MALLLPAVLPAATPTPATDRPLSQLLRSDFAASLPERETSEYIFTQIVDGKATTGPARLAIQRRPWTRDYYTAATWPFGQKPLVDAVELRLSVNPRAGPASMSTVALDSRAKALRLTTSVHGPEGITARDFRLWSDPPRQMFLSPRDGEGSGERIPEFPPEARFEEELPLILRSLEFREGLRGTFYLFDGQTTEGCPEPKAAAARLGVAREGAAWRVTVEAADGRMIEYDFAADPPHPLRAMRHSDGRSLLPAEEGS